MISILIPCYNYNALPLAERLEKEALNLGIIYEIICMDDASFSSKNTNNQKINFLTNSKFYESQKNVGRVMNRQLLAKKAQYNWLLFIDVDTNPKLDNFLSTYLKKINSKDKVYFGGFSYISNRADKTKLRFKFGKKREEINSKIRNKKKYKYIISSNFLIDKNVFTTINSKINFNSYGMDYYFGSLLKKYKISLKHIDNEVIHLGIDENDKFLSKTNEALNSLINLYKKGNIKKHDITILKYYKLLKLLLLKKIIGYIGLLLSKKIESNLTGNNPNLIIFDFYRISYLCRL